MGLQSGAMAALLVLGGMDDHPRIGGVVSVEGSAQGKPQKQALHMMLPGSFINYFHSLLHKIKIFLKLKILLYV